MTLTEASYSEDKVTTGSVNTRPLSRTERQGWSCSILVTVWSVTADMRTSLIARSIGSSNSAISVSVLKKYVQRYRRAKVTAAYLVQAVIRQTLRV